MEIVFLGTGGGRFNLIRQARRTGGFRINGPLGIHVDPGPGALFASQAFGQDKLGLDLIIITHNHIDHTNDAGLMVESISRHKERHGVVVGASSVIEGDYKGDRGISNYHLSSLQRHFVARAGKKLCLRLKGTCLSILPTKVRHEDKKGFGFVLEIQGKRIGYTSDTEYFSGISKQYEGCDVLIANCLKPKEDRIPGHLNTHTTARLFSEAKPKLGVITHLGLSLLKDGPEKNARKIRWLSGIKTIAAQDGMKISLSTLRATGGEKKRKKNRAMRGKRTEK
jgi:ribonuclease BN (tRNA processing enzyme)